MSEIRLEVGAPPRDWVATLPALAAVGVLTAWAADQGGYFARSWYPGALFLLALLVVTALAERMSLRRLPRATQIALAAFALFTAWAYLSITWADDKGVAWDGANRTLLYLIVFALFSRSLASERSRAIVLLAWVAATTVLAVVVLLKLPATLGSGPAIFTRLEQPLGYANANAALWLMALWPALTLAACRDLAPWLRGLSAGAIVVLAETALLSESRGALVATAVLIVVMFAAVPGRVALLVTLLAPASAIALTSPHVLQVANEVERDPAAMSRLGGVAAPILLAAIACGLAAFAAASLLADRPPLQARVRSARGPVAIAVAGLVLAGVISGLALAGDPVERVQRSWREFKRPAPQSPEGPGHLTAGFSGARYDYYRVALNVIGQHPVAGIGVDNFAQDYLARAKGTAGERPTSPHSLELRTVLQTGIVGAALLLVAVGAAFAAAHRALRGAGALGRASAAGGALCAMYWVVQGSVDWFWEFPALGGAAFACLGLAGASAPRPEPGQAITHGGSTLRRWAPVAVVPVLAAAGSFALPWTADIEVRRALTSWRALPAAADRQLELAEKLNPLSDQPAITAGSIAIERRDVPQAQRAFEQALQRDPRSAYATLWLGAIASHRGHRASAERLLRRALELAPNDQVTISAARQARSGRIDLVALNREIAGIAQALRE